MPSVVSRVMWRDVDDLDDGGAYDNMRPTTASVFLVDERAAADEVGHDDQDGDQ
jgi:hypothetical protein